MSKEQRPGDLDISGNPGLSVPVALQDKATCNHSDAILTDVDDRQFKNPSSNHNKKLQQTYHSRLDCALNSLVFRVELEEKHLYCHHVNNPLLADTDSIWFLFISNRATSI